MRRHDWDYCERRQDVEHGREMCGVFAERGYHSRCSSNNSGPGNNLPAVLIGFVLQMFFSCTVRCNVVLRSIATVVIAGVVCVLLWLSYIYYKSTRTHGKKKRR